MSFSAYESVRAHVPAAELQSGRFLLTRSNVCVSAPQQIKANKYPKWPSKPIKQASEEGRVLLRYHIYISNIHLTSVNYSVSVLLAVNVLEIT